VSAWAHEGVERIPSLMNALEADRVSCNFGQGEAWRKVWAGVLPAPGSQSIVYSN
jgi:hypothetical protein